MSSTPSADVSCRVAWADDAAAMANVQVAAWRTSYVDLLPGDLLDSLAVDEVAAGWHEALRRPDDARKRVLVALEHNTVRGFAVTGPAADPDLDPIAVGEIADITVDPEHRGHGHGSRLLQAGIDTLSADRFGRAVIWVNATDDDLRRFLTESGFGPDGAHRELDLRGDGQVRIKQVRLHTEIPG